MLVEGLSLITALSNAISSVLVSRGMRNSNPSSASLISTFIQGAILTGLLMINFPEINMSALFFFAVSGVLALGLGRLLYFVSVERLGVAVSSAIIGINPLITTVLVLVFLGEEVVVTTFIGAVLVVAGIFLLSGTERGSIRRKSIIIPFLSALSYALSNVVQKVGLNTQPDPLLGAQVGAAAGVLSFLLYLATAGKLKEITADRSALGFYSAAGLSSSVGWVTMMRAMQMGTVSVVTTIVFSYPLFSLLLSWLFLRGQEDLGWRVIAGCLIIVMGISLVTLF